MTTRPFPLTPQYRLHWVAAARRGHFPARVFGHAAGEGAGRVLFVRADFGPAACELAVLVAMTAPGGPQPPDHPGDPGVAEAFLAAFPVGAPVLLAPFDHPGDYTPVLRPDEAAPFAVGVVNPRTLAEPGEAADSEADAAADAAWQEGVMYAVSTYFDLRSRGEFSARRAVASEDAVAEVVRDLASAETYRAQAVELADRIATLPTADDRARAVAELTAAEPTPPPRMSSIVRERLKETGVDFGDAAPPPPPPPRRDRRGHVAERLVPRYAVGEMLICAQGVEYEIVACDGHVATLRDAAGATHAINVDHARTSNRFAVKPA